MTRRPGGKPAGAARAHLAVPADAVAALFLERQHLLRPRERGFTPRRLLDFVEDAGGLQLDSINVLERAHYLTVWSRFGDYPRGRVDRMVYRRRLLFEYWAHAACLVPTSFRPWWRRAMLDYRTRHTGWSGWLRRNRSVLEATTAAIRAGGPMGSADFTSPRPPGGAGWWRWRPVQHALHYLWMTGALAVHSRRHFQKRFDLAERVWPGGGAGSGVRIPTPTGCRRGNSGSGTSSARCTRWAWPRSWTWHGT
jgi:uncharacterized protein YcaQ